MREVEEDMYRMPEHDAVEYPMVVRSFISGHLLKFFMPIYRAMSLYAHPKRFVWVFRSTEIDLCDHAQTHTMIIFRFVVGPDRKGKIKRALFQSKSHKYFLC